MSMKRQANLFIELVYEVVVPIPDDIDDAEEYIHSLYSEYGIDPHDYTGSGISDKRMEIIEIENYNKE